MKNIVKMLILFIVITGIFNINSFTAAELEKDVEFKIEKDYEACAFTISIEQNGMYQVILTNEQNDIYEGKIEDSNSCIINVQDVKSGKWKATIKVIENEKTTETEETEQSTEVEEEIGKIKVEVKAISKSSFQLDDVSVARDIAGLKSYFKDNSIVVEWKDLSCGSVTISVIDATNNQLLDNQTVETQYYEYEIPKTTNEITVKVVPAVSTNIDGAETQFTKEVKNEPNATITYEDKEYTNTNTTSVTAKLGNTYSLKFYNNGKEVESTELLENGEYIYDIPIEEGINELLTYVVDEDGNMRSTSYTIIRDSVKPTLALNLEYDGLSTYDTEVYFEGNVKDYKTFFVNDTEPVVAGDGTFKADYILKEGTNTIKMVATDVAGNETIYTATVTKLIEEKRSIPVIPIIVCVLVVGFLVFYFIRKKKGGEITRQPREKAMKEKKESKLTRKQKETISTILTVVISIIVFKCILLLGVIPSESMESTVNKGNIAIVNGLAYINKEPQRGDIVVFKSSELNDTLIKRVIGLPGETISFEDGYVYIDRQLCYEEYIGKDIETNCLKKFEVPEGCYFLLGDNRENSLDARYWNNPYIAKGDIKGKYMTQIPLIKLKNLFK